LPDWKNNDEQVVNQLRQQHPELQQVEAALLKELATQLLAVYAHNPTPHSQEPAERFTHLRQERQHILQKLGLSDNYAQTGYSCPLCRDMMFIEKGGEWLPCSCWEEVHQQRKQQQAGISPKMQQQTFATFSLDYYAPDKYIPGRNYSYQEQASRVLAACQEFVVKVTAREKPRGLYIYGDTGRGKTHLAAAISNALLAQEVEVSYVATSAFLSSLRSSYEEGSDPSQSESHIMAELGRVTVLVLDDLGVDQFTPWAVEKFYHLINLRYMAGLPTVYTSNIPLADLDSNMGVGGASIRIVSRIAETCDLYLLDGIDIRFWKK